MYIGSFNADKPIRTDMNPSGEDLFNKEQADLLQDLFEIPQRSCDRKVWLLHLPMMPGADVASSRMARPNNLVKSTAYGCMWKQMLCRGAAFLSLHDLD